MSLLIALFACGASLPVEAAGTPCPNHSERVHGNADLAQQRRAMQEEIADFQRLAEETLGMRAQAVRFHRELREKLDKGGHLTGADLHILNAGAVDLLAQREALMAVAEAHECWTEASPEGGSQPAAIHRAGVAVSLASALLLYDNYLLAVAPYRNDHVLRQHFNRKDSGFELHAGTLNKMAANFASADYRHRMRRAILWYERDGAPGEGKIEGEDYPRRLIEQSPSLAMLRKLAPLRDLAGRLDFVGALGVDALFSLKSEGTHLSSLLFGNAVGLVETRHGKLYDQPEVAAKVASRLRAGDILVEKTPFRLTDTFIPGHWGHAALWIGNEAELRELGIWDHPVTRKHHDAIRAGHGVVEALRSGVEMNRLEHFMNIDDLGVLRYDSLPRSQRAEAIVQALRQIGKPYDFNFDAQTTDRVFCSKLVYLAYGDLQWPTSKIMGRVTVSPDNIAARALGDGPLTVALLYHDGQEVQDDRRAFMEKLMKPRPALALNEQR